MSLDAVIALYSNATYVKETPDGYVAYDAEGNEVAIDEAAVNAWVDPNKYARKRAAEYPPIGDQLDALFHAGVFPADMAAQIQAVKDKYPKESA